MFQHGITFITFFGMIWFDFQLLICSTIFAYEWFAMYNLLPCQQFLS